MVKPYKSYHRETTKPSTPYPKMYELKKLSILASSVALERIFSTFGVLWTKLRNLVSPQKIKMLVKIH